MTKKARIILGVGTAILVVLVCVIVRCQAYAASVVSIRSVTIECEGIEYYEEGEYGYLTFEAVDARTTRGFVIDNAITTVRVEHELLKEMLLETEPQKISKVIIYGDIPQRIFDENGKNLPHNEQTDDIRWSEVLLTSHEYDEYFYLAFVSVEE